MDIVAYPATEEAAKETNEGTAAATCQFSTINISSEIDAAVKIFADLDKWTIFFFHADFFGFRKLVCTDGYGCMYMAEKMLPEGQRIFQIHDPNMKVADKKQQLLQVTQAMYDMQAAAGVEKKHWRYAFCDVSLKVDKEGQEGFDEISASLCELVLELGATCEMIQIDHHLEMVQTSSNQMQCFLNANPAAQNAMRSFTVVTSDEVLLELEPSSKTMLRMAVRAKKANAVDWLVGYLAASTDTFLFRSLKPQKYLDTDLGAIYDRSAFIRAIHQLDAAVQKSTEGKNIAVFANGCGGGKGNYAALHVLLEAYVVAIEPEVASSALTLQGSGDYQLQADYSALFKAAYRKPNVMNILRNGKPNLNLAFFSNGPEDFERAISVYIDDLCQVHLLDGVFLWRPGSAVGSIRLNRNKDIVGCTKSLVKDNDMEIAKGILSNFEPQGLPDVLGHSDLVVIRMLPDAKYIECEMCEPPAINTMKTSASGYAAAKWDM